MMAVKRKHEDDTSEIEKPKKFKTNKKQKRNAKKPMTETQSTLAENSQNHTENPVTNEKTSHKSTLSPTVRNVSNENINRSSQVKTHCDKKRKLYKHWDRRKKEKKRNKSGTDDIKSVSINVPAPELSKPNLTVDKKSILKPVMDEKKMGEPVSCNWKKLKMDLKKTKPKKHFKKKTMKASDKSQKKETESPEPDIWFDDVDEELLKPKKEVTESKPTDKSMSRPSKSADSLVKEHSFKGLTKAVALDCEMVGVGEGGKESVLARVSVVNQFGECLYDTFVRSREAVVDYRTQWSGVTPEKLENAVDFLDAQKAVSDILRGRILVGHAVHHDLKVLFLDHPHKDIRDTSHYKPYRQMFKGRTPSLKNLTSRLLSVKIQTGEHNSVTDAQAAMRLYTFSRKEWEGHLKKRKIRKVKKPKNEKTKQ